MVNRPIVASPHALEEFPWLLRGRTLQTETKATSQKAKHWDSVVGSSAPQPGVGNQSQDGKNLLKGLSKQ
jgi:hypothetical protein